MALAGGILVIFFKGLDFKG